MKGDFKMRRVFTTIIFAGIFLFATFASAEIKTYDGYGETYVNSNENPNLAKLRAKDSAVKNAKDKISVDLMALSLSNNLALTDEEIFTIINNNIKETSEPDYKTEIIEHSNKTSVIVYKAQIKISVDTDGIKNWLKLAEENLNATLNQNKIKQTLTAEEKQKVADLQRRAENYETSEEIAEIKSKLEAINNNRLSLQKYLIGNVAYFRKDYETALKNYDVAIQLNPNNFEAYNNRGVAYKNLGQYERAIQDYDKAIELNPNYDNAHNNRGNAYRLLKQYEQAIQDYGKAIELNPNNADAWNGRAITYFQLKKYEQALDDFNKVIELAPKFSTAYYNRGICYQRLGDNDKAQAEFSKAKELGYNG